MQLTAALDAPLLLYLSADDLTDPVTPTGLSALDRAARGWEDLVRRLAR